MLTYWIADPLADIRHLQFDNSALIKHVFDNEHFMDRTNAKILDFKLDFTKHWFIQLYFINEIPNNMKDKQNDKFPSIYLATLLQTPWGNIIVFHAPPICQFFASNLI